MQPTAYYERLEKIIPSKFNDLRTLFDIDSHEWKQTSLAEKIEFLILIIQNGEDLTDLIGECIEHYQNINPRVFSARHRAICLLLDTIVAEIFCKGGNNHHLISNVPKIRSEYWSFELAPTPESNHRAIRGVFDLDQFPTIETRLTLIWLLSEKNNPLFYALSDYMDLLFADGKVDLNQMDQHLYPLLDGAVRLLMVKRDSSLQIQRFANWTNVDKVRSFLNENFIELISIHAANSKLLTLVYRPLLTEKYSYQVWSKDVLSNFESNTVHYNESLRKNPADKIWIAQHFDESYNRVHEILITQTPQNLTENIQV